MHFFVRGDIYIQEPAPVCTGRMRMRGGGSCSRHNRPEINNRKNVKKIKTMTTQRVAQLIIGLKKFQAAVGDVSL